MSHPKTDPPESVSDTMVALDRHTPSTAREFRDLALDRWSQKQQGLPFFSLQRVDHPDRWPEEWEVFGLLVSGRKIDSYHATKSSILEIIKSIDQALYDLTPQDLRQ